MNATCLSNIGYAYENERGDNCAIKNPDVLIKFKPPNGAFISKVQVQRDSAQNPGNVRQIQAMFLNTNGSIISDEVSGQPITWTSSEADPTIQGYFRDVSGLIVKVLKTDNNQSVKKLRLLVLGCYSLGISVSSFPFSFIIPFSFSLSPNVYYGTNHEKCM